MDTFELLDSCKQTQTGPVVPTNKMVAFLENVQSAALKTYGNKGFDPKLYVDMSLKFDLSIIEESFAKLSRMGENSSIKIPVSELDEFIEKFLDDPEKDLVYIKPVDFVDEPEGFLNNVKNDEMRAFALEIHSLWKNLSREVSGRVLERPDLHTLLPLKNPVMIPGSRFREVYYWDSYWVIRGLMVSKMYETAKGIVYNLISLIDQFGYVLNGARAYYTNRSQPPLLSSMVYEIYSRTSDEELVKTTLPALLKEYAFWNSGIHRVTVEDTDGSSHNLSRYYAMWNKPRPESATIDKETASKLETPEAKELVYRELASAAESGWDFSSRWMRNDSDLTTLATTSILPVDLNAFVLKMELDIAFLADVIGEADIAASFTEASKTRKKAMNSVFWNPDMGQWFDSWFTDKGNSKCEASHQNQEIFASNFIPLWIKYFHRDEAKVTKIVESLKTSGLLQPAGIATSLKNTGEQWDFPNGWAPLQHMIVEGLVRSKSEEARALAKDIAIRWIRTNYAGYKKTGTMHEKYDVEKCGNSGGGGEYVPQTGFGWSNGVVLAFLEEFGWPEDLKVGCD
ncbi:hypothetical protein Leryth_012181 [Lithospermum erythrorhizon]|nr:hypothetical protein Leryth_012181 [Lithospermum erythrorhizon]